MIDILLATYNGSKFLPAQIDSLLAQTKQDFKLLIRDDCSTDNTIDIIEDYREMYPDKITVIENCGVRLGSTKSFFELLRHSTADLIMFCDQDDVWNKDKLEMMMDYYNERKRINDKPFLLHTAAEVVDENLLPLKERTMQFNKSKFGMEKTLVWQIFQNDVTGCTILINSLMRDIVNKIDFTRFSAIQHDWLIAQIAYLYNAKYYLPFMTIKYRQHSNNVMGAKKITFLQRIILKIKYGTIYPFYDQIKTLLQANIETDQKRLLLEFAELKGKTKVYRIYWHINNNFFRDGGLLKKAYQLFAC